MNQFLGFAILIFALAACDNSGYKKNAASREPLPALPATNTPVTPAPNQLQKPAGTPVSAPVQTGPNSGTAALNPAHGLPGHRCDIPVGAPLNSAPASTPAPSPQPPALTTTPVVTQPQPVNGNVKLNPAHGLPGHDCSIPVGQPLKS